MLLAVTNDQTTIRLESRHLTLSQDDKLAGTVPVNLIDRVVLSGAANVSGSVFQALLMRHIPIIMLDNCNRYLGQMHYSPSGNCERIALQYHVYQEHDLLPAQRLLETKIYNQKRVLQRLATARKEILPERKIFNSLQRSLSRQNSSEELLGLEGFAAKKYFTALSRYIPQWCGFTGRQRQPTPDPFNAALSYSYTIMTGEIENLIRLHALDPGIGFLHNKSYNTPALALDLLEIFRACFCDMLVLDLFNHNRLRAEHFSFNKESGQYLLNQMGKNIFFRSWEKKRHSHFKYQGVQTTWQAIWNRQVLMWLNFLQQKDVNELKFYKMR